jgi:hypothetical protein
MALVLKDRVKETTTTTGTGTYTLAGAVTGFEAFSEIGDGNTTYYVCTDGADFEVGIGTYAASGTTLARTTILQSSNSDAAVNWTAGTRDIFITQPAEKAVFLNADGDIDLADNDKLIAGTGGDLEVYSDGTDAYIDFVGAASETLFIRNTTATTSATTTGVVIQSKASNPTYIHLINNGGVRFGLEGSEAVSFTTTATFFNNDIILNGAYELKFRNSSFYTTLDATAATADHTVTLPNATGHLPVFTTAPTSAIADGSSNQVLTTDGSGGLSFTSGAAAPQEINAQTGTTYTTVLSDAGKLVTLSNASAITLTIPPNSSVAYPIGTRIDFIQIGAGQVTVAGGIGVTVNSTPTLKFRAQHSAASCIKIGTDTWQLVGDLAES